MLKPLEVLKLYPPHDYSLCSAYASAITLADSAPNVLVVHPSLAVKSVKELIALAGAKPGALNYSASTPGGSVHLSGELLKSMAGINILWIPYKSTNQSIIDLVAGQVDLSFGTAAAVMPHVKVGRLRALAVTSLQPSALIPGLPPVAASGLPGYESTSLHAVFTTAGTPAPIINRLNQEIVRVFARPDVKVYFSSLGVETVGSSTEQLTAAIKSDIQRMGKVIRAAGIRAE